MCELRKPRICEILGRGYSIKNYRHLPHASVYSVNLMQWVFAEKYGKPVTLAFWMDDLIATEAELPAVMEIIKKSDQPVMTSKANWNYPNAYAYPIVEIISWLASTHPHLNFTYVNNSIPYVLWYAMWKRYDEIHFHGVDFLSESDRVFQQACVQYWIGVAQGMGYKIKANNHSFLLDTNKQGQFDTAHTGAPYPMYGYVQQPNVAEILKGR